jgi:nicotinamidase-related amidase
VALAGSGSSERRWIEAQARVPRRGEKRVTPSAGDHAALLIMDVQQSIVARSVRDAHYMKRLSQAIVAARNAEIQVVYVKVAFRDGHPEVSPRNRLFSGMPYLDQLAESTAASQIVPAIAPLPGDIVVTKRRVSAFSGSDLEIVLRARKTDLLILAGVTTSGVVLSTVREASDRDYRLVVLSDCCADSDAVVHDVLVGKVFPRQAEVMTARKWRSEVR